MNGRIGVLLKNLGNLYREQQHVLVVQSHFHPEPPRNFPLVSPPASASPTISTASWFRPWSFGRSIRDALSLVQICRRG
jgi:hypothetical protein